MDLNNWYVKANEEVETLEDYNGDLIDYLKSFDKLSQVIIALDLNNVGYDVLDLKDEKFYVFDFQNSVYIIRGDETYHDIELAKDWIYSLDDYALENYIDSPQNNFWDEVSINSVAYHGTDSENVDNIMKVGLHRMDKTRGLSNRNTGSAVFASWDIDHTESYGDSVIEINLGQMKADGYMPDVAEEEPVTECKLREALAWKLGLKDFYCNEEYSSDGISEDTIVIYGNIPAKYLSLYNK